MPDNPHQGVNFITSSFNIAENILVMQRGFSLLDFILEARHLYLVMHTSSSPAHPRYLGDISVSAVIQIVKQSNLSFISIDGIVLRNVSEGVHGTEQAISYRHSNIIIKTIDSLDIVLIVEAIIKFISTTDIDKAHGYEGMNYGIAIGRLH